MEIPNRPLPSPTFPYTDNELKKKRLKHKTVFAQRMSERLHGK